jgi:hypothetical protein
MALRTVLLTVANLLIPVAILIFATGFFPYKPFMPGLAQYEKLGWEERMGWKEGSIPEAPFDKLVFMVVDALRSDFVFGEESGMSFVQWNHTHTMQFDPRRHRPPLHSARRVPDHHHAQGESHHYWLHPFLSRRYPQLRRVRHNLYALHTRYVARATESKGRR